MLEDFAMQYVSLPEDSLRLVGYVIAIVGAVIAGIFHRSVSEVRRAPYFAYSGLLFFVSAASQLVWLGSTSAIVGGYLWVFMIYDVAVLLGVGYGFGVIAMARSRDAYGHGRLAVLAFIPLANFWLLLTPSKNDISANRAPTIPLLSGTVGVLTGIVLLLLGVGVSTYITEESNRIAEEVGNDPELARAGVEMILLGQGLEAALKLLAAEVPSQQIDDATTLLQVEGIGTTLRYTYEVSTAVDALPDSLRAGLVNQNCTYEAMRPIIEAGATLEHLYQRVDGTEIGTVSVSSQLCGY